MLSASQLARCLALLIDAARLVPERGEPTTKIGLFTLICIFRLRGIFTALVQLLTSAHDMIMNRIAIGPEGRFSFGGENFVITVPVKEPRLSTSEAFTIAKNEAYLRVYEDLASAFLPRSKRLSRQFAAHHLKTGKSLWWTIARRTGRKLC